MEQEIQDGDTRRPMTEEEKREQVKRSEAWLLSDWSLATESVFEGTTLGPYRWFSQTRLPPADSRFTVLSQQSGEEGPARATLT